MNRITRPIDLQTFACSPHGHFSRANFALTDSKDSAFDRSKVKTSVYTGYNETMADAPFRWLDDSKNVTKRAALRKEFDGFLQAPDGHLDAREMIDRMIEIVPADTGRFRNVVPKATEDMLKAHQLAAWENQI